MVPTNSDIETEKAVEAAEVALQVQERWVDRQLIHEFASISVNYSGEHEEMVEAKFEGKYEESEEMGQEIEDISELQVQLQ